MGGWRSERAEEDMECGFIESGHCRLCNSGGGWIGSGTPTCDLVSLNWKGYTASNK